MSKFILIILLAFSIVSCDSKSTTEDDITVVTSSNREQPEVIEDQFSYVFGYQTALNFSQSFENINLEYMAEGVSDALQSQSLYTYAEMEEIVTNFQTKLIKEQEDVLNTIRKENLKDAENFLKSNSNRKNIIKVNNQVQYEVLKSVPEGKQAQLDSTVTLDYQLVLLSGEIKDSSYQRGESSTFDLKQTIPGFALAVSQIREGEKIRAWIHPELGYGENGTSNIEPNELLIFDVELISVNN